MCLHNIFCHFLKYAKFNFCHWLSCFWQSPSCRNALLFLASKGCSHLRVISKLCIKGYKRNKYTVQRISVRIILHFWGSGRIIAKVIKLSRHNWGYFGWLLKKWTYTFVIFTSGSFSHHSLIFMQTISFSTIWLHALMELFHT